MDRMLSYTLFADRLVILVHGRRRPSDAEWDEYCATLKAWDPRTKAYLIVTPGGGPNGRQRKQLNEIQGTRDPQPKIAVVTSSPLARGIATAFSWLYQNLRSFAPHRLEDALAHLEIDPADHAKVLAEVERLEQSLSDSVPHKNAS